MKEVKAYLAALPADQRAALNHAREIICAACPDAVEDLGYGMPRFKYRGKPLVAVAAWKNHLSLYGGWFAVERHSRELAPFKVVASTIQFTVERPLPDKLLARIVRERMAIIDADRASRLAIIARDVPARPRQVRSRRPARAAD